MLSANLGGYSSQLTAIFSLTFFLLSEHGVEAQITADDTAGTRVETQDNVLSITGGIESGTNLFHSFEQFSLSAGEVANFDNGIEIENIFSRVTGGSSEIHGLIQTQGNASLFLLNPAGVVFGADAQLDIGGSFIVSTADRLIFADGTEFSAIAPTTESLLTISSPIGLQYGMSGAIAVLPNDNRASNSSGLGIYPGATLALLGGDVAISRNSLNTVGSKTEIAAVRDGNIELQTSDSGWQFDYQNVSELGKIDLSDRALINSGRADLRGETISFSAGSGIIDFNQFGEAKNSINLNAAKSIELDASLLVTQVGATSSFIDEAITANGGDITINAPQVSIGNGTIISVDALSQGTGGNITINAPNTVKLYAEAGNNPVSISTSTRADGLGGSIAINTGRLSIRDGSQIQALAGTEVTGKGGKINVRATREIELSGTGILRQQSFNADGTISIQETELASGLFASSGDPSLAIDDPRQDLGESGSLAINTPRLSIEKAAKISVNSYGLADAGDIEIGTSSLNLDTTGKIVANTASGEGGSISVTAEELILLDRASSISTTASAEGNGGNITLTTANLALLEGDRIQANATTGNGGNILIDTQGLFIDPSSSITAGSEVETKQGNVEISTLNLSSRIATDYRDRSPFLAEKQITSSCGVGTDLNANHIRDIGRGGMPSNLFRETMHLEALSDWGDDIETQGERHQGNITALDFQPIVEVNHWTINDRGTVELIAHHTRPALVANCQINRSQIN